MFRMTYNQANIRGGIIVTCSCNFVFGMQLVSTKEFQRNLAIPEPDHSLCLEAESARGRGRTRLDYERSLFFLSPSREMRETRKWPH